MIDEFCKFVETHNLFNQYGSFAKKEMNTVRNWLSSHSKTMEQMMNEKLNDFQQDLKNKFKSPEILDISINWKNEIVSNAKDLYSIYHISDDVSTLVKITFNLDSSSRITNKQYTKVYDIRKVSQKMLDDYEYEVKTFINENLSTHSFSRISDQGLERALYLINETVRPVIYFTPIYDNVNQNIVASEDEKNVIFDNIASIHFPNYNAVIEDTYSNTDDDEYDEFPSDYDDRPIYNNAGFHSTDRVNMYDDEYDGRFNESFMMKKWKKYIEKNLKSC